MVNPFECTDLVAQTVVADAFIARELVVVTNSSTGNTSEQANAEADTSYIRSMMKITKKESYFKVTTMTGLPTVKLLWTSAPPS